MKLSCSCGGTGEFSDNLLGSIQADRWLKAHEGCAMTRAENFKLAANQCVVEGGLVGDEGGTPYCTLKKKLDSLTEERKYSVLLTKQSADRLRADANRCEFIRRNPYRAMDLFKQIDVNQPALWREQFNSLIDGAMEAMR